MPGCSVINDDSRDRDRGTDRFRYLGTATGTGAEGPCGCPGD